MAQQVEIMDAEIESRAEGGQGPGHEPTGKVDSMLWIAAGFIALGYTPVAWAAALIGYGYFGPIAWPAVLAMVGVLFAVIALLRAIDTGNQSDRKWSIILGAIGLVRLFVLPIF